MADAADSYRVVAVVAAAAAIKLLFVFFTIDDDVMIFVALMSGVTLR